MVTLARKICSLQETVLRILKQLLIKRLSEAVLKLLQKAGSAQVAYYW